MKLSRILLTTLLLSAVTGCSAYGDSPSPRNKALPHASRSARSKPAQKEAKKTTQKESLPKTFRVRTTAYTGKRNAIGTALSHGPVISAASDWSRFPLGTRFKVRQTGKTYVIDDYGSALVGTNTIDLAKQSSRIVNAWGVRWVDIDILEWGSSRKSLEVLTPRERVRYVKPMVRALREQASGMPHEFHRVPL